MSTLLTFSQQQAIKKISANNQAKYTEIATEVEDFELSGLLGIALTQDLQANPGSQYNLLLLNGTSFTNYRGQVVSHKGLRYVLAYLNYAKYIGISQVADTFSGMVAKRRDDSDLLQEGTIKRLQNDARKIALTQFELIKDYLNSSSVNFPLWLCSESQKTYTPKFANISKTSEEYRNKPTEEYHFPVPRTN